MPIWIESLLGLAAIALCAVACWREDKLVEWENSMTERIKQRKEVKNHGKTKIMVTCLQRKSVQMQTYQN